MRAYVRQLVAHLLDPETPLSRNRHFDALDDEAGRLALRISRRLRALERALLALSPEDLPIRLTQGTDAAPIRLEFTHARLGRAADHPPHAGGVGAAPRAARHPREARFTAPRRTAAHRALRLSPSRAPACR